jgi:hypothetical protein
MISIEVLAPTDTRIYVSDFPVARQGENQLFDPVGMLDIKFRVDSFSGFELAR